MQTAAPGERKNRALEENSFTKKLKENREAFKHNLQATTKIHRSQSITGPRLCEFATPNCSDIGDYQIGKSIGHGAYAVVKDS